MDTNTNVVIPTFGQPSAIVDSLRVDTSNEQSFVMKYDPKVSEIVGYRNAVIRYRLTGTNKVERTAQMVTIPSVKLPADTYLLPESAATVLIGVIEDQQDTIIRELLEQKPCPAVVSWTAVTLDAALAALTATRVSSRLTSANIDTWVRFIGGLMLPTLVARGMAIADIKGYPELLDDPLRRAQVAGTVNAYAKRFGNLAAAVPNLGEDEAKSLQAMLASSKADDDIARTLNRKLHAILNPKISLDDL